MAKLFLITYDLRKPGQNYSELYDAIKASGDWQHPMESAWVIRVGDFNNAKDIYEGLREKIDDGDYLFVVDITDANGYGWLSNSFWSWYKQKDNA